MQAKLFAHIFTVLSVLAITYTGPKHAAAENMASCAECHPSYCQSWPMTTHGGSLAAYTPERAAAIQLPQSAELAIGTLRYSYKTNDQNGWIEEKSERSQSSYKIAYILGGKNIIVFLTQFGGGRLQVLPLAYSISRQAWFDNTAMLPHGISQTGDTDGWRGHAANFNADCYSCHVNGTEASYSAQTGAYKPLGDPQGISCSSCHGPTDAHVQAARKAQTGGVPDDYKIFSLKKASSEQINDTCGSCHATRIPLTATYTAGQSFFNHFDIKTLENKAFFSDGRTLGDSHIFTQWKMSPCTKSGKLQCLHCHTAGGSYRFQEPAQANDACLPCHKDRVEQATKHTHHKANSPGNFCIACHMPMIELMGSDRTDHSMRPPLPVATRELKSPNACTLCHDKNDVSWAENKIGGWIKNDYQKPYLYASGLIQAARTGNWTRLPDMLSYIEDPRRDEITAASLIRLLRECKDGKKWPVLINCVKKDPSPLVRSAAAGSLMGSPMGDTASVLFAALNDTTALVRIRAVSMLAVLSSQSLLPEYRPRFEKAFGEFTAMLAARPDEARAYYNLGNLYLERRDLPRALAMYEQTLKFEPNNPDALLNSATAQYYAGQTAAAEQTLRKALKIQPSNAQAHVTLGMLLMEQKRPVEAEVAFRMALKHDPANAAAYYNLAVMHAADKPKNSLDWCRKALELEPDNPKYSYTYAYYLNRDGKPDLAIAVLKKVVDKNAPHPESYALLADLYIKKKKSNDARNVYRKALENKTIPEDTRKGFMEQLQKLE